MAPDLREPEIPGVAKIMEGPGGLRFLSINSPAAEARIFLQGAQLTHWQPNEEDPVIFLSACSAFERGKAIRGGVPVCFPWFGPRPAQTAHGFARNRTWRLAELTQESAGTVRAEFVDRADAETRQHWPCDYQLRLTYRVGSALEMRLEVENTSAIAFTFSEALHTYFVVGDVHQTRVTGLENTQYRDFPDRSKLTQQLGPIAFTEEIDRVYINTAATCVLEDPALHRRIVVDKTGSNTTTIWNPWISKSAALADFGDDEWQRMVCIETVNAFENSITLEAGETHCMSATIRVERL
jgi:glucose-6-phosphate 1-epimerase